MLPESALICSCNNVSKGQICAAVEGGLHDARRAEEDDQGAPPAAAAAGRSPSQIVDAELKKQRRRGQQPPLRALRAIRARSCSTSFSIERDQDLRRAAAQARQGPGLRHLQAGRGVDPRLVLERVRSSKPKHAPLQDTNDHFLANMQKDGTYSVVPRVPGGEITPEKLIVIGQVAKKYGLYTKITGGQRIDLFGARVEQLPLIWKRAGRRRLRVRPRLRQGAAHGEVLRRLDLVPLRRAGLGGDGDRPREPLPRPARAAQDQDGGVGLHARVRRGAGQGRRRHRHREGLEPLRLRQRRHEAAARRPAGQRPRRPRR